MRRLYLLLLFLPLMFSLQQCVHRKKATPPPVVCKDTTTKVIPGWTKTYAVAADVILYVMPDAWVIELQGTDEAPTQDGARNKMQFHADAFVRSLKELGVKEEDITVSTVSQERITDWREDEKGRTTYTTVAYSVTKSVLVRYTDVRLYSQIISKGSEHRFDRVTQNYCTVGDEQAVYAELYRQGMEVAIDKQTQQAQFYKAAVVPGSGVPKEKYSVATPTPGVYVPPGSQSMVSGYDRVIGGEYGTGAVRYTLHLDYSFTLQKKAQVIHTVQ